MEDKGSLTAEDLSKEVGVSVILAKERYINVYLPQVVKKAKKVSNIHLNIQKLDPFKTLIFLFFSDYFSQRRWEGSVEMNAWKDLDFIPISS